MSLMLVQGGKKRVIRIGRFAGQYAKPRSADMETRGGLTLPSYRGDMINEAGFSLAERTPNPELLLRAYERSGLTINFIRALIEGGFANLHHPEYWELAFVANSPHAGEYMRMVQSIGDSLRFMETLTGCVLADINRVGFLQQPRGLAPSLRAGADPQGAPPLRDGTTLDPFPLDRRPHPGPSTARMSSIFGASSTRSASKSVPPPPPRRSWPWPRCSIPKTSPAGSP